MAASADGPILHSVPEGPVVVTISSEIVVDPEEDVTVVDTEPDASVATLVVVEVVHWPILETLTPLP